MYISYVLILGTFEMSMEAEEDIYEVINIGKIKAHTPNLRIVNMYGITFIDDTHIELLTSNCIHIETLALNFCLRVKGSSFKSLVQRCKKLKTLLLQHTGKRKRFCQVNTFFAILWYKIFYMYLPIKLRKLRTSCFVFWKLILIKLMPIINFMWDLFLVLYYIPHVCSSQLQKKTLDEA